MKSLLPYFVKNFEDSTMAPKKYPDDCTVERLDQKPIIIITYNKNIFSTNNKHRKL